HFGATNEHKWTQIGVNAVFVCIRVYSWPIKKAARKRDRLFTTGLPYFLPEELHAYLDLAGKHVLRRHRGWADHAERGAGRRGVVVGHQAEEVVVEDVERFKAQLDPDALGDLRHLQHRGVQRECMVPADLAGAVWVIARRITG